MQANTNNNFTITAEVLARSLLLLLPISIYNLMQCVNEKDLIHNVDFIFSLDSSALLLVKEISGSFV